jgi:UDP-N-acetylmuramoyl-L-alanyl-D-glutamate--2,6-diaminopimelate ligase
MARISDLIRNIDVVSVSGEEDPVIDRIEFDSRKVTPGTLFVAVKGTKTDGHDFIGKAVESGATAVICEILPEEVNKKVCWIKTIDSAKALGIAASEFFGNPSSSLKLTGVTGTNGKTTIATLLYRMFSRLGY